MVVVIISGMPAVGKTTAAMGVAKRLGLRYYSSGDALKELAIERGYKASGDDWWDTGEGMRFLEERRKNPDFDKEADEKLRSVAELGNVALTSYTAPWLLTNGVKFWLSASAETRARRMASRDHISYEEALKVVQLRDSENKVIYKKLYGIGFGSDLSVFDFVLGTENLSSEDVVDIICSILRHLV